MSLRSVTLANNTKDTDASMCISYYGHPREEIRKIMRSDLSPSGERGLSYLSLFHHLRSSSNGPRSIFGVKLLSRTLAIL